MIALIEAEGVRDLAPLALDGNGELRVLPASFWAETTRNERALFGQRHGVYCFPTVELIEWLKRAIGDRSAIEIGSGNGVLAKALGIPATDNRMQEWDNIRAIYASAGQPVVTYGDNVESLNARDAVAQHRPDVVVAAWVTHRFNPQRPELGGNVYGVDEVRLLGKISTYLFIGNMHTHGPKPLWAQAPAELIKGEPWLVSRALTDAPNFVARWERG